MADITDMAVGEQQQASGSIQSRTTAQTYPPSWIDRLLDWVQRLPGPVWLFYLGVALLLALSRTIIGWSDGSYPVGTFLPVHIMDASSAVYFLFVLHYLDNRAGAALAAFRSVLTVDDAGYQRLRYQLTTMPTRPALLWSFVALVFGLTIGPSLIPEAQFQQFKYWTSPAAIAFDVGALGLNWMMSVVFAYHTIRQLRLISEIYTLHTKINVFDTGPLYGFSRVTALTTVALLFLTYMYVTFWANWQLETAAAVTIAMAFVLVALATFVWPLLGAHRLLQEEKAHWKGEVAHSIEAVSRELHRRVNTGEMESIDAYKDALDGLVVERGVLDKVSTWPWEPETVRVVVTAILLPAGLWIITRILERLGF